MIRDIRITAVANGFIVYVGCQVIVFTGISLRACSNDLCIELYRYLTDPEGTEARWRKDKCFNLEHTLNEPAPCDPVQGNTRHAEGYGRGICPEPGGPVWLQPDPRPIGNCTAVQPSQCCDCDVPS